jgi:hypothetical protein
VWGDRGDGAGAARLIASSTARGAAGAASAAEVARAALRVAAALDGGAAVAGVTVMSGRGAAAADPPAAEERAPTPERSNDRALAAAGWSALAVGLSLGVTGAGLWRHAELRTAAPLLACGAGLAAAGTVWSVAAPGSRRARTRSAVVAAALWTAAAALAGVLAAR